MSDTKREFLKVAAEAAPASPWRIPPAIGPRHQQRPSPRPIRSVARRRPLHRFARLGGLALAASAAAVLIGGPSVGAATGGKRLWVARYNDPASKDDGATSLAVSPDGSMVFVTGRSGGRGTNSDYATVAYEASTGMKLWVRRYNGPGNGTDAAVSIAISPDNSKVFVTGYSRGTTTRYDYTTLAYDVATGARRWVNRYNGPGNGNDIASSLAVSPDGSKVYVTGHSHGTTVGYEYATVAYDSSTGARLWVKRSDHDGEACCVAISPDGRKVFVTGTIGTVAYSSSTGARLWAKRSRNSTTCCLTASPDGRRVFISGSSASNNGDYSTAAYNAENGRRVWLSSYNGNANGLDDAFSLAVSPSGARVFVTGRSGRRGACCFMDYATLSYNASSGRRLWVRRYNGPGNSEDQAASVAVSTDGSEVFVTGQSGGTTTSVDYATLAYGASSGVRLWLRRYSGPGSGLDVATSVLASPDGSKVFVTGWSISRLIPDADYATLAYEP